MLLTTDPGARSGEPNFLPIFYVVMRAKQAKSTRQEIRQEFQKPRTSMKFARNPARNSAIIRTEQDREIRQDILQ